MPYSGRMPTPKGVGSSPLTGLSARLLVLTIFFVMLSEVFIYAPSIGRYRLVYMEERIAAAHLAALATASPEGGAMSPRLTAEILEHARSHRIVCRNTSELKTLVGEASPEIDEIYDLREAAFFPLIWEAFLVLGRGGNRIIEVVGPSPRAPETLVRTVIDEAPMRYEMLGYSERILFLSIVISLITATLVYISLQLLFVRPMLGITESMIAFRADPEDARCSVAPSSRTDEIGRARRELASMQSALRQALRQRSRLAALGTAVTKINHDLRNILASAQLVSDHIRVSPDPRVRQIAPTLLGALDRAIKLCSQTLAFAHDGELPPSHTRFDLRPLVEDVVGDLGETGPEGARFVCRVPQDFAVEADRDQLRRVLTNLILNAYQATAKTVSIGASLANGSVTIEIADDGPGLPEPARARLFEPFSGSSRIGGTGLGLSIARDLMRGHGGDIRLATSGETGTVFEVVLPAEAAPSAR